MTGPAWHEEAITRKHDRAAFDRGDANAKTAEPAQRIAAHIAASEAFVLTHGSLPDECDNH